MMLGTALAAALVVGMQLPLVGRRAIVRVSYVAPSDPIASGSLSWPGVGSAAIDIPSLGVLESHDDQIVPIASLTKMMTAYVTLKRLPLAPGESGPCHVVTSEDVATYDELADEDESSVEVQVGERLCELQLLEGLLVHSAGNYAVMLADMVGGSPSAFVALMNDDARHLGLVGTHYADATGFSPQSVSSALDQVRLAVLLMRSPLVRSIVEMASVTLPVAGTVGSFTPDVGIDGVVGVKSGRTAEAGGCDALALTFRDGASTKVAYAVVLGQQGGDLLGPAGEAALALARSAVAAREHVVFARRERVGELSAYGERVGVALAARHEVWYWPSQGPLRVRVVLPRSLALPVRRGQVVGHLVVSGAAKGEYPLVALAPLTAPTWWQRLR